MNKHLIIGNLTRDPDTGTTESGINWCRFTVAVNRRGKKDGQPEADFVQVTAWRGLGDTCAKWLKKGKKVACVGESRAHAWMGQDGNPRSQIELTADDVEFLSPGGGREAPTDADAPGGPVDPQTGYEQVEPEEKPW